MEHTTANDHNTPNPLPRDLPLGAFGITVPNGLLEEKA